MSKLLNKVYKQNSIKNWRMDSINCNNNLMKVKIRRHHHTTNSNSNQWKQPEGYDTGIMIYNCITRTQVPLIIKNKNYASWYTCGPTVYDSSHIGHASCYVKLDIIQRILRNYFNINLITAMNITDIDDKIIKRSQEMNLNCKEISKLYEMEFWNDLRTLNVELPNIKLRVTDNIPLIISFISEIYRKQLAYIGNDKSVYFKASKFPNYGKLQKLNLLEETVDKKQEEIVKESAIDFVLWKAKKANEPFECDSPWGSGRPGWHIECSTLSSHIFGETIDFHAGGLDLKFPHHENEEAQSCAYHNVLQWVNYWIHTGHLNLKDQTEKMSKSLKNTISINEMLEKYSSDEFRIACLLSNYRTSMEFSDEMMATAVNTLRRFVSFDTDCQAYLDRKKQNVCINSDIIMEKLTEIEDFIDKSLKNDFNTAKCLSYLLELIGVVNKMINLNETKEENKQIVDNSFSSNMASVAASQRFIWKILEIFGLTLFKDKSSYTLDQKQSNSKTDIENLIEGIVEIRKRIRQKAIETKNKDLFKVCDEIRSSLNRRGVEIKDHNNESSWSYFK